MLAKEIPMERAKISLYKQQRFSCRQQTGFFSASQQGISHMGKGRGLPCCSTKNLLECTINAQNKFQTPVTYFDPPLLHLAKVPKEVSDISLCALMILQRPIGLISTKN